MSEEKNMPQEQPQPREDLPRVAQSPAGEQVDGPLRPLPRLPKMKGSNGDRPQVPESGRPTPQRGMLGQIQLDSSRLLGGPRAAGGGELTFEKGMVIAKKLWNQLTDGDFVKADGSLDKLYTIIQAKVGITREAIKMKIEQPV